MDYKKKTLEELSRKSAEAGNRQALVGFDGFVDHIMKAVDKRSGQGTDFTAMPTITDFGNRILAAAGESANIELFPETTKIGGNGPIMAMGVLATGVKTRYVGALGQPIHPVFEDFAKRTDAVSITGPGITNAVEFEDGKIMLGNMASLDEVTFERTLQVMGEGALIDAVSRADLIALVNWTMLANMTGIFTGLLDRVLPNLGPKETGRTFFFDLADPRKRSDADLRSVLRTIARFRSFGTATLGLNLAEARQVARVLDLGDVEHSPDAIRSAASRIRSELELSCVVVHPREGAAAATRDDAWWVDGPFCEKPKISTGAGDNFNAGFSVAQMLGLSPPACLTVAVATSGQYVRNAKSPSLSDTAAFISNWS